MKPTSSPFLNRFLDEATRLTRSGRLGEVTAAVQRALGRLPIGPLRPDGGAAAPATGAARFVGAIFASAYGDRAYKLFVPGGSAASPRPLVVMLHGCTQDPDDFAAGTRMNPLAERHGFVVLYPAQAPRSNASKCWNWFQPADQKRGAGEPALLAAMTRAIVAGQAIDADRVYVAGLSAGGAMAAILGQQYRDVFAAVGVHSGLAPGAAHDVASAFSAMRHGRARAAAAADGAPVIVFHGDQDSTVHPANGVHVIGTLAAGAASAGTARHEANGRSVDRDLYRGADGRVRAELWRVHGAGHAWSGGDPAGSYADAAGPDASAEMLRFFREHPREKTKAKTNTFTAEERS